MLLGRALQQHASVRMTQNIRLIGQSLPTLGTATRQFHASGAHGRRPREDDVHQKPYSTPVFNQTYPPEAPTSDTIVPSSMLDAFNNMFDRGPNVGVEIISKNGFVLSNNVRVDSPLILLNGSAFMWNVPQGSKSPFENWNEDMLKIFEVTAPKPELILFGTGKSFYPVPPHLRNYLHKLGIQVDQMSTVSMWSMLIIPCDGN
jgi:NADH dehydrogenase [ubiquinone] 1 alpha subcomplex assembly factor 3